MLTGYNTDVEFAGKVYHVQTEDREGDDPIFESLVYHKGQILDSYRTHYANLVAKGYDQGALATVLESQHKRIMRWIKNGRYDPDVVKPFGEGIISDRSFDEVVLKFLNNEATQETPEIRVEAVGSIAPGWTGAVRATLRTDRLNRPMGGCPVRVELAYPGDEKMVPLAQGDTDAKGTFLAEITLPEAPSGSEIVVTADTNLGAAAGRLPLSSS